MGEGLLGLQLGRVEKNEVSCMFCVADVYAAGIFQYKIQVTVIHGGAFMGKGDRRSRRGKIYRGTFGKTRPRKIQKTPSNKSPGKKK